MTRSTDVKHYPLTLIMNDEAERIFHDATLDDLVQIRQFVRKTAVSYVTDLTALDELIVAVNEAAANIIRHGYQARPGDIKLIVSCCRETIKVTLLDTGSDFNPTAVSSPDTTAPLEERPFGGMGIHMMREFCDKLSYRRTENNKNELTLLKRVDQ